MVSSVYCSSPWMEQNLEASTSSSCLQVASRGHRTVTRVPASAPVAATTLSVLMSEVMSTLLMLALSLDKISDSDSFIHSR